MTTKISSTVSNITASDVGLGNVTNESKTTMFSSPSFTGNVATSNGTVSDQYGNLRAIQQSSSDKTTSYILDVNDTGRFIGIGSGGSITVPSGVFATGSAITLYNNTTGNITITCSAVTTYVAGTNTVRTSLTLATRGLTTILFVSSSVCVISGNVL